MCRFLLRVWQTCFAFVTTAVIVVVLTACQPSVVERADNRATSSHYLVSTGAATTLTRRGWAQPVPIGFGTALQSTDLLNVEGEVRILCADLEVNMVSGIDSVPCRSARGILKYRGADFLITRAAPGDVPYPLFPRNTLLLDSKPQLRWHDTGAAKYTVALRDEEGIVWSRSNVVSPTLDYPADEPPLLPGVTYNLWVRDEDTQRTSDEGAVAGFGFQVANAGTQAHVDKVCGPLAVLPELDAAGRDFAYAVCLASLEPDELSGYAPKGEAAMRLELLSQQRHTPAVLLWYADILVALDLMSEAKDTYTAALAEAEQLGDVESQIEASKGLWCLATSQAAADDLASRVAALTAALLSESTPVAPTMNTWCEHL